MASNKQFWLQPNASAAMCINSSHMGILNCKDQGFTFAPFENEWEKKLWKGVRKKPFLGLSTVNGCEGQESKTF